MFGVFLALAAGLVALCFVCPLATVLREIVTASDWSEAALGPRRWGLVLRGIIIAGGAGLLAQILGAGLAAGLTVERRTRTGGLTVWACLLILLTPPYIYAYAWSLVVLPGGVVTGAAGGTRWPAILAHEGRAIWCLGTWTAPVAAAVLATGWRLAGRAAYRLALLDATPTRAWWHAARSPMLSWLAISLVVTSLLSITEHTVCDLCQAPTWNTEILACIQNQVPGEGTPAGLFAWPLLVLVAALTLALWPLRGVLGRLGSALADWRGVAEATGEDGRRWSGRAWIWWAATLVILLLPWALLVTGLRDAGALRRAWTSFPREWPDGLLCAAGAAVVGLWLAIGVDFVMAAGPRRLGHLVGGVVLALAAIVAVMPPSLVGDAFAAAYLHWPWLSDHWPVVSIVTAARFALLAIIGLRLAGRRAGRELTGMAATDGAGPLTSYLRVRLPQSWSMLVTCGLIVGVLSLTEVPASQLVRPAGVESVAVTVFNEIHNGRNDEIIAMSLYMMVGVAVVVTVVPWVGRLRRQR
ncbi:MAG: hypothetical protein PVJ57_02255 [Phycisphaerae bacterium]